jgi:hypothetical protein
MLIDKAIERSYNEDLSLVYPLVDSLRGSPPHPRSITLRLVDSTQLKLAHHSATKRLGSFSGLRRSQSSACTSRLLEFTGLGFRGPITLPCLAIGHDVEAKVAGAHYPFLVHLSTYLRVSSAHRRKPHQQHGEGRGSRGHSPLPPAIRVVLMTTRPCNSSLCSDLRSEYSYALIPITHSTSSACKYCSFVAEVSRHYGKVDDPSSPVLQLEMMRGCEATEGAKIT